MKWIGMQAGILVVVLAIVMLIVPLPTGVLDFLFLGNLSVSLVVAAVALQVKEPLEFSGFPSLLLVTTLIRVALDISAARLILLNADAGEVVAAFGHFVVGDNLVVGILVFLLLFVVQFLVITKGAERVAEVTARFTLDAMAGKQMAIDADLHAGSLTDAQAKARRQRIAQEADFYGAMDGATKFVRGDAIATLVVLIINVVAGLVVGVLMQHMAVGVAAHTYTSLAIGDALLSQLPAFLLSMAAGILVTRSNSQQGGFIDVLSRQIGSRPEPFYIVAGFLLLIGTFLHVLVLVVFLAAGSFYIGYRISRRPKPQEPAPAPKPQPVPGTDLPDALALTIGYGLLPVADPLQGGDVVKRLRGVVDTLSRDLGFPLPGVHVKDDLTLAPNHYRLKIRSVTVGDGAVYPGRELVVRTAQLTLPPGAVEDKEPIYGLPAAWIPTAEVARMVARGVTTTPPAAVIAAHVKSVLMHRAYLLFDRQALQSYLDKARRSDKAVVEELIPALATMGVVHKVLQNLLREGIPIADAVTILEALADYAPGANNDVIVLTERVRTALASTIRQMAFGGQEPGLITLDDALQATLEKAARATGQEPALNLHADFQKQLVQGLRDARGRLRHGAVLVSPALRPFLARTLERALPDLPVLSVAEIDPAQPYAIEQVSV